METDDVCDIERIVHEQRVYVVAEQAHLAVSMTFRGKGQPPDKLYRNITAGQRGRVTNAIRAGSMFVVAVKYFLNERETFRAVYWSDTDDLLFIRRSYSSI